MTDTHEPAARLPDVYDPTRAFGTFVIRDLDPVTMDHPHWHGHIEINLLVGASMTYDFNGASFTLGDGEAALFWAGVPHRVTAVHRFQETPRLTNIYLPLDRFLLMPHIERLQQQVLSGVVFGFSTPIATVARLDHWRTDLAREDVARAALVEAEINTVLRRALLDGALNPRTDRRLRRSTDSRHHVVTMVRHIVENLDGDLSSRTVANTTGLHPHYAMNAFSRTLRVSIKQFVIRMRLARARAMLIESALPVTTIASLSGFGSMSQFYSAFRNAYGRTPRDIRLAGRDTAS